MPPEAVCSIDGQRYFSIIEIPFLAFLFLSTQTSAPASIGSATGLSALHDSPCMGRLILKTLDRCRDSVAQRDEPSEPPCDSFHILLLTPVLLHPLFNNIRRNQKSLHTTQSPYYCPFTAGGQRFSLINLFSITWSDTSKSLAMPWATNWRVESPEESHASKPELFARATASFNFFRQFFSRHQQASGKLIRMLFNPGILVLRYFLEK